MSSLTPLKVFGSLGALALLGGCATTATAPEAATEQVALSKPTQEEIDTISRADALTQATFWNDYYNAYPADRDIALRFIKALRSINSHDRAAEIAKTTSLKFPEDSAIHLELGRANVGLGNYDDAVLAYQKAADLAPFDATPYAAMGILFDSRNAHERAQTAYRKALALDPNRPITLSNMGLSLALLGELEQAETALRQATALPGATTAVRQNLALILGLQGKFDEARSIAEIDAPEGVAQRNADFLKQMIGNNARLRNLAENGAVPRNASSDVETPSAAPTSTVASAPLEEVSEPNQTITAFELRPRARKDG